MAIRTSTTTVTFQHPFTLEGLDPQPAGDYVVDTDEELLEGISFPVYQRVSTQIHLHASAGNPGRMEIATVDPILLQRALSLDAEAPVSAFAGVDRTIRNPPAQSPPAQNPPTQNLPTGNRPAAQSLDTLLLKAWGRKRP
jgi:hypothetical protein